jgi:uncharacterized membrane protein YgdD (TMEM256/DUF423 family)
MHRNRVFVKLAGLLGALTVLIGAFGAHMLKEYLQPEQMSSFQTGVAYQFYHVLAILAVGVLYKRYNTKSMGKAVTCFLLGILLFSGSLYASAILQVLGQGGLGMFALITPIGGVFLILGWVFLFLGVPMQSHGSGSEGDS